MTNALHDKVCIWEKSKFIRGCMTASDVLVSWEMITIQSAFPSPQDIVKRKLFFDVSSGFSMCLDHEKRTVNDQQLFFSLITALLLHRQSWVSFWISLHFSRTTALMTPLTGVEHDKRFWFHISNMKNVFFMYRRTQFFFSTFCTNGLILGGWKKEIKWKKTLLIFMIRKYPKRIVF